MRRIKLPSGTTRQQWVDYEKAVKKHRAYCDKIKPLETTFKSRAEFERAYAEWQRILLMDAPNAPGYYIANNE
jgi:hypothetical protein